MSNSLIPSTLLALSLFLPRPFISHGQTVSCPSSETYDSGENHRRLLERVNRVIQFLPLICAFRLARIRRDPLCSSSCRRVVERHGGARGDGILVSQATWNATRKRTPLFPRSCSSGYWTTEARALTEVSFVRDVVCTQRRIIYLFSDSSARPRILLLFLPLAIHFALSSPLWLNETMSRRTTTFTLNLIRLSANPKYAEVGMTCHFSKRSIR